MASNTFRLDEITKDIYRISTFVPFSPESLTQLHPDMLKPPRTAMEASPFGLTFNQFLIVDESPTLVHTGMAGMFEGVIGQIREVLDPKRLKFIVISHFEADECGALNHFLELASELQPIGTPATALNIEGFAYRCKLREVKHDDRLPLGSRTLRFIDSPSQMHLWEGLIAYKETSRVLFSGDLCWRFGESPNPIVEVDLDQEILSICEDWFNIPD